ncbi:nuclear transcription factor Y subunit alpha-like [Octopus sinensis]|uniref:Nuclear transcription factor Y subunit alpha-like n=1 Tax=Octopus sinensis TaxID=2607531 RepID=A0A6P7TMG5_9MOLL|nr:nuclear transcription factor Y subunit alpha-like [Octopus sinensis]
MSCLIAKHNNIKIGTARLGTNNYDQSNPKNPDSSQYNSNNRDGNHNTRTASNNTRHTNRSSTTPINDIHHEDDTAPTLNVIPLPTLRNNREIYHTYRNSHITSINNNNNAEHSSNNIDQNNLSNTNRDNNSISDEKTSSTSTHHSSYPHNNHTLITYPRTNNT